MNGPIDAALRRKQLEAFAGLLAEKRRRAAKAEHQTRGYRDADGVWRGGLLSFVRYFWHVLEPETPFVSGWVLEAVCEHLEAVTFGEIQNLLINVFPGAMKSLLTNVFFPAWEWGPQGLSHLRYVTFSYSSTLTERDNLKFLDLVSSPEYQLMYGREVMLRQRGATKVSNTKHGWKLASSVSGTVTGQRGNRAICFPGDQMVQTESGPQRIGDIVERRLPIRVPSYDITTGEVSLQPITGWHRNPASPILKITLSEGSFVRCTPEHKFWSGVGWIEARLLRSATPLPVIWLEQPYRDFAPSSSISNALYCRTGNAIQRGQILPSCIATDNLSHLRLSESPTAPRRKQSSVLYRILDILPTRAVLQIVQSALQRFTVDVSNLLTFWTRPKKGFCNKFVNQDGVGFPVLSEINTWIPLNRLAEHYPLLMLHHMSLFDVAFSVRINGHSLATFDGPCQTFYAPKIGNLIEPFVSNDRQPFLLVEKVEKDGHADVTYCLTVDRNHTFIVGSDQGLITSNCDDLNNVKESESQTILEETNRWFRESLSSRLNNMVTDAKIVIAQRTAENDVSGTILDLDLPYTHLCIPMRYVWSADDDGNPYATEIGWIDPRWRENPDDCDDALAWEERFPRNVVDSLERELGPYATACQLAQTPEPRGGGILKRDFWQPWTGKFPAFSYVFASLDGAFTEDESNDPSALSIWGVFENAAGHNRAMLIFAWRKFLEFEGQRLTPETGENQRDFMERQMREWGLIEWTAHTCSYWKVDRLLIEAKASGISAAQSLQKRYRTRNWAVQLTGVKGDKVSRAIAVQPTLSNKMVYAPIEKEWCGMLINEAAIFPYGTHDDLTDTVTQALKHLRDLGLLEFDEDIRAEELRDARLPEKDNKLRNYLPGT